jgi:2-polyprenyl-3-methyl-5-hydroxy-6-metoxy-1,4-benzoquinol methylase
MMICPACHRQNSVNIGMKNSYPLLKCGSCKTIFAEISTEGEKSAGEMQELYDHYYDGAKYELPKAAEISLSKMVDSFAGYRQTGNFVDIGFGEGGMLSVAERKGWNCFGTELSPHSLKYGESRSWIVSKDAFEDARFPKEGFDVVTMVELIEHVPNPDFFFQTAFRLLRPNGLLFLTTPNPKSINQRVLGSDWSVISPPEHITLWSPQGLRQSLKRNGFETRTIRTDGLNPVEIISKFRNRGRKPEVAVNRNEAAFALNEAFTSSPWRQSVKSTINQGLSLFKLGDGIKVWAQKI